MRLPPSVRYLPSRLQVMSNPWLWLGILVAGMVGIYGWEYRQNPGQLPWQLSSNKSNTSNRASTDSRTDATSTDELLELLTPEEQAVAAELDNIELLLTQLDSNVSALTTGGETSAAASLNTAPTNVESGRDAAPALGVESSVDRLTRYIDQYQFLGANTAPQSVNGIAQTPVQRPSQRDLNSSNGTPDILALGERLAASATLSLNSGAEGVARQQAQRDSATSNPSIPSSAVNENGLPTAAADTSTETSTEETGFSFGQVGQLGGTPGQLDGFNQPFMRTTPSMSPPPGTTGYTPPPGSFQNFNQPNPLGTSGSRAFSAPSNGFGDVPTVDLPNEIERTQVLPPASRTVVTPLEPAPLITTPAQPLPRQPRNAWEDFFD